MSFRREDRAKEKTMMGREAAGNRLSQESSGGPCWVGHVP